MKKYFAIFGGIALILLGVFIGAKIVDKPYSPPDGYTLISQAEIDSLNNLEPEVVFEDSVVWRDTTIYRDRPVPAPQPTPDPEISFYPDSIVNDSTFLVIHDWVRGEIVSRDIEFRRAVTYTKIKVPYPKFIETVKFKDCPPKWSLYGDLTAFGNKNIFIPGVEVGFITKGNTKIGFSLHTDLEHEYIGFSIGKTFDFN